MNNLLSLVQRIKVNASAVEWLKTIPIIVISTRMVEAARNSGFQTIVLAWSAEDAAIIQAIKEIREGNS
jgi:uroporphyrinogen-III synthase